MKHRWLIFIFFLLNLMKWKPLAKMNLVADLSLGIKVWDILFYLPGESDVGASSLDLVDLCFSWLGMCWRHIR